MDLCPVFKEFPLLSSLLQYFRSELLRKNCFSIFISAFLLIYSQSLLAFHWGPFPGRYDCPEIANSYECALSLEQKINLPFIQRVSEKKLDVVLLSGEIRSFINAYDDPATFQIDETLGYSILEVVGDSRYVVLGKQFGEGGAFSLLDRKTGAYHKLIGYPVFSPDGKKLIEAYTDFSAFSPTVLQIYKVIDGAIELEYKADVGDEWSADWGAEAIVWQSSSVITFTKVTIDCSINESAPCENKSLKYNGKGWEVF